METPIKYFVYILESLKDSKFYIGQTNNLQNRLKRHNAGHVKATTHRRPLKLVYQETYASRSEALKREKYLKDLKSHTYIKNIILDSR
ncbi:MAG: GIY-YIG nuclease family protein [Parcubacteria group bacterium]|jgi:putative endonuclease